jgi:salicylate hydroxylase
MPVKRTAKVAIIGGGIGGLAAALALNRRGIEVAVYEQSAAITEIGAGVNMSPNALKAFRLLGVEDAIVEIGHHAKRTMARNFKSGRVIRRQENSAGGLEARYGAKFLTIHRADLLDVLAAALPDSIFHLGHQCTGVEPGDTASTARFKNGHEIEADIIVGADGIRSAVRASLFGAGEPRFTGCVCWRGMVPMAALAPADRIMDMTAWWGPHGHVVHYPVRRGALMNFVAHFDSDAWTEDSWTQECDLVELTDTFAGWNDYLHRLFRTSDKYYKWALYDRDPIEAWGRGTVTMLGDAVHPMLPYLGQGACTAVEDGCVLAELLAPGPSDLAAALRAYEGLRIPRTTKIQAGSRARAKFNHLPSRFDRFKRDVSMAIKTRIGADKTMMQSDWIYDYEVTEAVAEAGEDRLRDGSG